MFLSKTWQVAMLSFLRGTVHSREITAGQSDRLVLDVAGVGFEVAVSRRTLLTLPAVGEQATLHTSLAIRENDWTLFGFSTGEEREMFNLVQSVSGVGPKLALALVGTLGPEDLADGIIAEDYKLISQAPGVGAKLAQRLILELKSKIEDWQSRRGMAQARCAPAKSSAFEEVRNILEGLGYTPTEINIALKRADEDQIEQDVELLVRHSLKVLGAAAR
jgi:Holliday junction DNA helicase RuvA